jgi:hypothetical protein
MRTMRTMAAAATVVLAAVAGCGGTAGAEKPGLPPAAPDHVALTGTWIYPDGVRVTLSQIRRGRSSLDGSPADTPYVSFTVGVFNGSTRTLNLVWLTVGCTAGDRSAGQVFDDGLDTPDSRLLPGDRYDSRAACAVPPGVHGLEVETSPDMDHGEAVFTGRVA